ncbi:LamG-like jellyroll fold domain-containing protein [Kribbella sp. NPDC051587]|uniref:LamG-like jellyroll fold domain-containing protein n=1 Tax=Kribbella sp. NPDC051587 TaxID=3364119 RepID=UPI0037B800E6
MRRGSRAALARHERGRTSVAVLAAIAVLTSGLQATPTVAAPPPVPKIGRNAQEAAKFAAAGGAPVEIADRTTELSQTFANPDGSLTAKLSNAPVRVKQGDAWRAVDTNLEFRPDGTVGPKAAISQITLSGGGNSSIGKVGLPEGAFELKSPWQLPRPTLSGSIATYAEVAQGLDLVVESTSEGLSYNVVVKTREAASNPALRSIHFPVTTQALSLRTDREGGPTYADASGRLVLTAGDAMMWDSSQSAQGKQTVAKRSSAKLVDDGPAGAHAAEMELRGDSSGLTLVPDAGMLTSPSTVYPVVLDPVTTTPTKSAWAAAWQLYPTTSFFKTTHSLGVGYEDYEQHKIVRSFFQFVTTAFRGKKILSSKLRTFEVHSASCSARSVSVTRTTTITDRTTWNNQPGVQLAVTSQSFANGYSSSCPDKYVEFPVTNSMADTAAKGYTTSTFRLAATDETDGIAWKQFSSLGELEVTYVSPPAIPTSVGLKDPNVGCDSATSYVNVGSKNLQFTATPKLSATDPGARVQIEFWFYSTTGNPFLSRRTGLDSPNTPLTVTLPNATFADQGLYHFRARTIYPYATGAELKSVDSAFCYFKVDKFAPGPPMVTAKFGADTVKNCDVENPCEALPPPGAPISFTIKAASADVVKHEYWFQGASSKTTVTGNTVIINIVPTQEGHNRLHFQSFDGAGHGSGEITDFVVNVKSASPPIADWSFDEPSGTTAADQATPAHALTLSNGAKFDDAGRSGGSLQLDGVDDYAETSAPVVDTSKSFTVSAWARLWTTKEAVVIGSAGNIGSAFELRYSQSLNRWVFVRSKTDTTTPIAVQAKSDEPAVLGAWTHLVGVYDQGLGKVQLYVNGRLQTAGNVPYPDSAWKATGPLSIGQGHYNGVFTNRFVGSIDSVQIWQRGLNAEAVMAAADPRKDDKVVTGLAAHWPLDSAYLASDQVWRTGDLVYAANMPISGFGSSADQSSAFVTDDERGPVLSFSGSANEALSLPRPFVDAGTSFSAGVWVKLADPDKASVVLRQAGADRDAWRLEWRPVDEVSGEWVFTRTPANSTEPDIAVYPESKDAVAGDWRLLIGAYDAAAPDQVNGGALGKITLSVDKGTIDGSEHRHTSPYRLGSTVVGKGRTVGGEFAGWIDDIRLYTGALDDRSTCAEYPDLGEDVCPPVTEG